MSNTEGEDWLWCSRCNRFFQSKDLTRDSVGGRQGCAFEDCRGEGYNYDIFEWDSPPREKQILRERWPKSTSELSKGLKVSGIR